MKLDSPEFTVSIPQPVKDEALDAIQVLLKKEESADRRPKLPPTYKGVYFNANYWGMIVGEERDSFFHLYVAGDYYFRLPAVRRYFVVRVDPQGVAVTRVRETPED